MIFKAYKNSIKFISSSFRLFITKSNAKYSHSPENNAWDSNLNWPFRYLMHYSIFPS